MARDDNNTISTAEDLGEISTPNGSLFRESNIGKDDNFDFYRFIIKAPSRFSALVVSSNVNTLSLRDANNQGIDTVAVGSSPNIRTVSSPNLQPGTYFLQVSSFSDVFGGYQLTASALSINRAETSVTLERITTSEQFDTKLPFSSSHRADFKATISINGQSRSSGVFNKDSNDVKPNFNFTQPVSIFAQKIPFEIKAIDVDPDRDDPVDFIPFSDELPQFLGTYTPTSNKLQTDDRIGGFISGFPSRAGISVSAQGEGVARLSEAFGAPIERVKQAKVTFRVDYNTFTASSAALRNAPMIVSNSQNITGRDVGGILVGNDRHNHLSAKGGNDALCGGKGRDLLDGGTGNDISYGGEGKDVHVGSAGRDVFVVDLDHKSVDLFKDFQVDRDRIGLPFALQPDMIELVNHRLGSALKLGSDTLAIVQGVQPDQIDANNFIQVDFANIRGVEVPYVMV
jgi:serralysin